MSVQDTSFNKFLNLNNFRHLPSMLKVGSKEGSGSLGDKRKVK